MKGFTKTAWAMAALFALLCAGCSGGGTSTTGNNNGNPPGNNTPSGTIQGSAK